MKRNFLSIGFCLSTAVLISACVPASDNEIDDSNSLATATLTETYWKLTSLNGETVKMAPEQEREKNIIFKNEDSRVNGFAGCNQFFGQFTATMDDPTQGTLSLTNLGSTKMACPDSDFNEQDYLTALANASAYIISGESLVLLDVNQSELAAFDSVYLQ